MPAQGLCRGLSRLIVPQRPEDAAPWEPASQRERPRVIELQEPDSFIFPDGAVPSILNDMEADPFIKISKLLYDYDYLAFT